MEIAIIIIGLGIIVGIYLVIQKLSELKKPAEDPAQKLMFELTQNLKKEMEAKLDTMNERLHRDLTDSSKTLQTQFRQSASIIQEVTEKLTKLDETNKQVLDFSKQLQSLENILKNPKERGILGEYFLETLLANVLQPNQYKMQHSLGKDEKTEKELIVDAAIFFKDKIIPIDAKFSLEKYNKIMEEKDKGRREKLEKEFKMDVKNRIDETAKYIRPSKNTTDFAFMFIPAEGIYYNLLIYKVGTVEINTHDLIEYAFKKHVIIVSPTSFYAYLETVLHGLKALQMEESVKEIIKKVEDLGRHLNAYEDNMQKVGKHLSTTVGAYNDASKEYKKIDKDVYKLTDGKEGGKVQELVLDKPTTD